MISIRCPVCTNQISYIRLKTNEGVCTTCGNVMTSDQVKSQREAQIQAIKQASIEE